MGKRAKGSRWFVANCAETDEDFVVVRGFASYALALAAFRSTLTRLQQGRPPGFDPGVDLVDFEGSIILTSAEDRDLGTAPYVTLLHSGAMRVRLNESGSYVPF